MVDYNELSLEYAKCYQDKSRIYTIQNYLTTYDATKSKDVPFQLFPRQQDLCRTRGEANNVVTTKPRQAGITTTCGGFISAEILFAEKDAPITVLCIGNTLDLAQQMLYKIRDFAMQYPTWLWGDDDLIAKTANPLEPPEKRDLFKKCNDKELIFFNGSRVVARSSGPHASRGVGGVTWLIFDEAAFIDRFVADHCRPHAVVMAERLRKFVAERQMAMFAADDGPAFALAAGPTAKAPASVKAPDEPVTFVFASEGEDDAPGAWRAELAVPPGATAETPLTLKVGGRDVAGVFALSGVKLPLVDGAAEIPFGVFLAGIKDTDVSLRRPGGDAVKGKLLFF